MASNQNSIKQMSETNNLKRELQRDIQLARKKFEGYDKLYAGLSGDGKKYLQNESKKYKRTVLDIQQLILPSVQRNCPSCINCCKLDTPELSIYIAGSLGCLQLGVTLYYLILFLKIWNTIYVHSGQMVAFFQLIVGVFHALNTFVTN